MMLISTVEKNHYYKTLPCRLLDVFTKYPNAMGERSEPWRKIFKQEFDNGGTFTHVALPAHLINLSNWWKRFDYQT